ncbi:DUF4251 domain-containing protein [Hyunsoonleella ulvae]|uniref:DUF4251 domain-containing protein n=1 Tax=Hyunsoonleella ulvae TaxID=2799948 RepID=UPI00193A04CF|nr:DUF4251 domain-containing protein [Hyunsoonleella ulvae]
MKKIYLLLLFVMLITVSCKTSKATTTDEQHEAFKTLIASQEFTIESDWAYPQLTNAMTQVLNSLNTWTNNNGGSVNLIGNANFLTIKGDSVTSYLPYFGERQMQVGYGGTDSAIQFNGLMENLKIEDGKKGSKIMSFMAKSNSENFNVIITMFPNHESQITLNGNSRFFIRYSGQVMKIPKVAEES